MEHVQTALLLTCVAAFAGASALSLGSMLAGCAEACVGLLRQALAGLQTLRRSPWSAVGAVDLGQLQSVLVGVAMAGVIACGVCVGGVRSSDGLDVRASSALERTLGAAGSTAAPIDEVRPYHAGLAAARSGRMWGFVNEAREYVIPPQFHEVGDFRDGVAIVNRGWQWGLLEATGKWVVEPKYMAVRPYSEDLAPFCVKARWGYLDRRGAVAIPPKFVCAGGFARGRACVALPNLETMYIDHQGRFVQAAS